MRGETDKGLLAQSGQSMLSLEEAGGGDYGHCSAIGCLETSPVRSLLLPVFQLGWQISDTHALLVQVSVSFHIICFLLAILEITKIYVGMHCA